MTTEKSSSSTITPTSLSLNEQDVVIFDPVIAEESSFRLSQKGNALLCDLVFLQLFFSREYITSKTRSPEEVKKIASHIYEIFTSGQTYMLPGTVDITQKYLKGGSRFMKEKKEKNSKITWEQADEESSKKFLFCLIRVFETKEFVDNKESFGLASQFFEENDKPSIGNPEEQDIVFAQRKSMESLPPSYYNRSKGKERYLNLIDEYLSVTGDMGHLGVKRAEAAVAIMNVATERGSLQRKTSGNERRFISVDQKDNKVTCNVLQPATAAEITLLLLFEKLHETGGPKSGEAVVQNSKPSKEVGESSENPAFIHPGKEPIAVPEPHDVLFGRGGLTNNHPGNKRFRDIISLHRPDYVRAIKVEKPNVSRRIVRAIRSGLPPGRFLKKNPQDDMWYDVGDKHAAEKTSQALREKIRKGEDDEIRPETGKRKLNDATISRPGKMPNYDPQNQQPGGVGNVPLNPAPPYFGMAHNNSNIVAPSQLRQYGMGLQINSIVPPKGQETSNSKTIENKKREGKNQKQNASGKGGIQVEKGGRANAEEEFVPLDKNGNILVTDHDILCGRGGLTNHHIGNKRFRDVVALHRPDYVRASKVQKPGVARMIVQAIRNSDPPGRFLKKNEETGKWYDVGDKQAAIKASQALREKTKDFPDPAEKNAKPALLAPRQHPPHFAPYTNIIRGRPFIPAGGEPPKDAYTNIVRGRPFKSARGESPKDPDSAQHFPDPVANEEGSPAKTVEI